MSTPRARCRLLASTRVAGLDLPRVVLRVESEMLYWHTLDDYKVSVYDRHTAEGCRRTRNELPLVLSGLRVFNSDLGRLRTLEIVDDGPRRYEIGRAHV